MILFAVPSAQQRYGYADRRYKKTQKQSFCLEAAFVFRNFVTEKKRFVWYNTNK